MSKINKPKIMKVETGDRFWILQITMKDWKELCNRFTVLERRLKTVEDYVREK